MIRVVERPDDVAAAAAIEVVTAATERAISAEAPFRLVLAGGTTPRALYERLASPALRDKIPWADTHLFFGDERTVPPDHAESNHHMAQEALLSRVPVPPSQVHRWQTELPPEQAAAAYADTLQAHFGSAPVTFDVVLLGLGPDAHTASLFPGVEPAYSSTFTLAAHVKAMNTWRLSLTPEALGRGQRVIFLVSGAGKADALACTLEGPPDPARCPAQRIVPVTGQRLFLVDRAAASRLTKNGAA